MNNFSRYFFFGFIVLFADIFSLKAQQLPIFTQYREYHSYINPATISHDYFTQEYNLEVGISYRSQWVSLSDAPKSYFIKAEYIWRTKGAFNLSFGGYLLNRNTDPIRVNGMYGKVAALFSNDPYFGAFSIGFTFGGLQYQLDLENLRPYHLDDAAIAGGNQQKMSPDIGIGVFYYKQFRDGVFEGDVVYGGVSVPQLLETKLKFGANQNNFYIDQKRHVFGVIGYYKYFDEASFLQPSLWIRYVPNAPIQFDLLTRYQHKQLFWVGGGFSTGKIAHIDLGLFVGKAQKWNKRNLKIGYGFDYPFASYGTVFGTAHEINIAFLLDTQK